VPFVPNATPSRRQPSRERFTRPDVLLQALEHYHDDSATSDLLFLMAWEVRPTSDLGVVLRIAQIRRANPVLAAELRAREAPAGTGARTRRDRAPFRRLDSGGAEVGSIRISGVSRSGGLDGGVVVGEARVPSRDDATPNDMLVR
jgi:hypothetical protein